MILMYSDLHIRPERLEVCELVLDKIFEVAKVLKGKGKDVVIYNGGDTFNTRGVIRTVCFDRLYHHYRKWEEAGFKQIINVGNHDQEDRAGEIHPMRVFSSFKDWMVIDKPTYLHKEKMAFFPYMKNEEVEKIFSTMTLNGWDAFVHWGIRGAKRNDWNTDKDGIPIEWLKDFRNVFSGHYHYRSKLQNVQYIGSPFQQNFGEMGQEKGVLVYDNEKNKTTFFEIKGTPKHHEVKVTFKEDSPNFDCGEEDISPQDFVRVKAFGDSERVSLLTKEAIIRRLKNENISIDRQIEDKHFTRLGIESGEVLNAPALMEKYVGFVETALDKKKLLTVGMELVGG